MMTSDSTPSVPAASGPQPRRKRPRWVCRLIGHRYRSPVFGYIVHIYMPSAEGSWGLPDPRGKLIGTCGCGYEWRSR